MSEKVAIITLGCEKNLVDSEIMSDLIDKRGYQLVERPEEATVVIVNTCGFIDAAKEESIDTILEVANLKKHGQLKSLLVAGCLTQRYKEVLIQEMPEIDGLVGTGDFDKITQIIEESLAGKKPIYIGNPVFSYENVTRRKSNRRAPTVFVKIAEGCDNDCTFCIIPSLRGNLRSRTIESIVREVAEHGKAGVKEICLIAQDLTNYGMDLYGKPSLPKLLYALESVEGIEWIRLHYIYPGAFNDELLDAMVKSSKVVPYIDMPLQHSEDSILRRMRRPGRQTDIRQLIGKIRDRLPDVAIRTSIIVGFPGETEDDFNRLVEFIKEIKFDRLGVFTYSQEEGTPAARIKEQVDEETKERRANQLMEVQRLINQERNSRLVGREIPVLIEKYDGRNHIFIGRTAYDAPEIDGEIYVSNYEGELGQIIPVRVTHSFDFDLAGEAVNV